MNTVCNYIVIEYFMWKFVVDLKKKFLRREGTYLYSNYTYRRCILYIIPGTLILYYNV